MVGRTNQKTKTVRFNLSKDDERRMFEELESHDRKVPDDPYGSSGAYIKAALDYYMQSAEERKTNQVAEELLSNIINQAVASARKVFMDDLKKHNEDQMRLLLMMRGVVGDGTCIVQNADLETKAIVSEHHNVEEGHIIQNADEGTDSEMAPEVDAYLSKWGL